MVSAGNPATGAKLASVRERARELAVNQDTVLRVYERLAREGLLDMRQIARQGTTLVESSPATAVGDGFLFWVLASVLAMGLLVAA